RVSVGANAAINLQNKAEYSVSAWIKPNTDRETSTGNIFRKGSTIFRVQDQDSSGNMRLYGAVDLATTDAVASSTMTIPRSDWTHVVMTYASTTDLRKIKFYINGILSNKKVDTAGVGNPANDSASILYIGGNNGANTFDGMIDEVKIYLYELTPEQVRKDYNTNKGITLGSAANKGYERSDGLISHWKMDEASWATTSKDQATVMDSIGANNGAPHYDASTTAGHFGNGGIFGGSTGSYISISDGMDELLDGRSNWTFSGWFYPRAAGKNILGTSDGNFWIWTGYDYDIGFDPEYFGFDSDAYVAGVTDTAANFLIPNEWVYMAITRDKYEFKLYKNGSLDTTLYTTTTDANGNITGDRPLHISRYSTGASYDWDGMMDDLKLYHRTLSADEVMRQYLEGPGPVGQWDFDEGKGTKAYDKSANANTGTLTNMEQTDWVPGKIGTGLRFDGVEDYAEIGQDNSLLLDKGGTLTAWVYIKNWDSASTYTSYTNSILSKCTSASWLSCHYQLLGVLSDNSIRLSMTNGTSGLETNGPSTGNLSINKWYHIVATWNTTDKCIYTNGNQIQCIQTAIMPTPTATSVCIGCVKDWDSSRVILFDGLIDDVRIYNYALTPFQIAQEYNDGSPIAYWNFDENNASTTNDISGANNGTLTGEGWRTSGKVNSAILFDGVDDRVSVGANAAINLQNKAEYSISAWIKPNSDGETSTGNIFRKGSTIFRVQDEDSSGNMRLYGAVDLATTDAVASSTMTIPRSDWTHVIMTYASTTDLRKIKFYINGMPSNKKTDTAGVGNPTDDSASTLYIGGNNGANTFDGMIDEVKIFLYELPPERVRREYNSGYGVQFK
ncbi:LamG domain-containing protein, partial [Patescibacteria group bacterium]|nr:LamG domain-containing protein [Patescibacteria group bacterium]